MGDVRPPCAEPVPVQKVVVTIEAEGRTLEATFSGDELQAAAVYASRPTREEPDDLAFLTERFALGAEHRFHFDLSVRDASNITVRSIEEPA